MLCATLLLVVYILATVPLTAQDGTKFHEIECERIIVRNPTDRSKMLITPGSILIRNEKDEGMFVITLSPVTGTKSGGILFKNKDRGILITERSIALSKIPDPRSGIVPKPALTIAYDKGANKPYIMLDTIPHDSDLFTMIFPGDILLKNKDGLKSLP
jgi:hypothetical protein